MNSERKISYPEDVGDGESDLPRGAIGRVLKNITAAETVVDETAKPSFTPPEGIDEE
jgi:hypothetical protein